MRHKAAKGELRIALPAGLEYDVAGQPVLLAACVPLSMPLVHPAAAVARLLIEWYATLMAGSDDG